MAKFRSWNEEFKFFIYWENGYYYYIPDKTRMYDDGEPYRHVIARRQNTETFDWQNAEQSTGKFDKSGKEAFVGDKVLFDHCGMIKEAYIVIHKNTNAFYLDNREEIYYPLYELESCEKTFKIIGNIHEGEKNNDRN